jgi:excisionase family DNA binding protein
VRVDNSEVQLLRPVQVAELLNVSRSKVYEMIAARKLPSVRLEGGRLIRVPYKALLEWVEAVATRGEVL